MRIERVSQLCLLDYILDQCGSAAHDQAGSGIYESPQVWWKSIIISVILIIFFLTRGGREVIPRTPNTIIELRRRLWLELEGVEC